MHYVPESKPVDDLLREMQRDQSHFAVVVDEYGGTAGPGHDRGHHRGDRGRDRRRVRPRGARGRGPRRRHASACPRRWTSTTSPTCSTSTSRRTRSTRSAASSASPSDGCRSSGSRCEVAGLALTAERMAGRRHRIASVIVERLVVPTRRPTPRSRRERTTRGARARGSVMTASGSESDRGVCRAAGCRPTSPASPAWSGAPTPASRR